MPITVNYYRLGRRLTMRYPELVGVLLTDNGVKNDVKGQIPELYQKFVQLKDSAPSEVNTLRLEFIAVIVKHIDPEVFTTKKKLRPGVRAELAELFSCDETQISHILKSAKTYFEIYKEFHERVNYLYSEMFESNNLNTESSD